MKEEIIGRGAEAILIRKDNILIKRRIKKGYRHEILDTNLRKSRTKHEARILDRTGSLISVPEVKKVTEFEIDMDFIQGKKLSDYLDTFPKKKALNVCYEIGRSTAKIHENNIIHGDLTTSNMIWRNNQVYFIDFGLGFHSARIEDKAVDLHLLREALESKHFKSWQNYFKEVIKGYKLYKQHDAVLKQLEKVELRGRYKGKK